MELFILLLLDILLFLLIIQLKEDSNKRIKKNSRILRKIQKENKLLFNYIDSIYEDIERLDTYEKKEKCK